MILSVRTWFYVIGHGGEAHERRYGADHRADPRVERTQSLEWRVDARVEHERGGAEQGRERIHARVEYGEARDAADGGERERVQRRQVAAHEHAILRPVHLRVVATCQQQKKTSCVDR